MGYYVRSVPDKKSKPRWKVQFISYSKPDYARERMDERMVSELDIVEVANTLKSIRYQIGTDTYLLTGVSTWKEKLMVSAAFRGKVIIVTVFFEE